LHTKAGSFYADWRDSQGRRHRAAFPTRKEALAHQSKMRGIIANPHTPLAGRLRGQRSNSSKRKNTTATSPRASKRSFGSAARKALAN
jgi:hypothetical protein